LTVSNEKKTKVFTCRGLYEEHISAFKSLSNSHDHTECTAPFKNYLTELLKYYKQDIVWKEFQGIFNKEHRKGRLEDAREEAECRISTSLKITLLYFRPDLITFITSCTTLKFIYRPFSIYYELSLTFLTNKREQETHFLYFCFQNPYCIANAHTVNTFTKVTDCFFFRRRGIHKFLHLSLKILQ
jgi:hypothetical protein